jgi:hypothetical protein
MELGLVEKITFFPPDPLPTSNGGKAKEIPSCLCSQAASAHLLLFWREKNIKFIFGRNIMSNVPRVKY